MSAETLLVMVVHWLHVLCGAFWFGTVLFTRIVLFPVLRTLPSDEEANVRAGLVGGRARAISVTVATATVVLGIVRGAVSHAFADLSSPYGLTFLAALLIGLAMLVWLVTPWLKTPAFARLYVAGFPVMFTLMVAMRFGY
ncbi:MAG TPA: hypothetical protein VNO17_07190 [Actinomycetota bacterium]|nr:hypothetical protein [Actinomycetota bacterium]